MRVTHIVAPPDTVQGEVKGLVICQHCGCASTIVADAGTHTPTPALPTPGAGAKDVAGQSPHYVEIAELDLYFYIKPV